MNRRRFFAILATIIPSFWVSKVFAESVKPTSEDEAVLKLLKDNGIVNKNMTWEKIDQISKKMRKINPNVGGAGQVWVLVVKGKFIYKDDGK